MEKLERIFVDCIKNCNNSLKIITEPKEQGMINALMANKDLTVDQMHRLEALEDNKSQAAAIKQKMVNGNDWRE